MPPAAGTPARRAGGLAGTYCSPIVELKEPSDVLPARRLLPNEIVDPPQAQTPALLLSIVVCETRIVVATAMPKSFPDATEFSMLTVEPLFAAKPVPLFSETVLSRIVTVEFELDSMPKKLFCTRDR